MTCQFPHTSRSALPSLRDIWQQMACEAHAAEEMLLAAFRPGPLNLARALLCKSDSKLKLLRLEHILIIMRHLKRSVLPPSRDRLCGGTAALSFPSA